MCLCCAAVRCRPDNFFQWLGTQNETEAAIISRVASLCAAAGVEPPGFYRSRWDLQADETAVLTALPSRWLRHGRGWLVSQVTR